MVICNVYAEIYTLLADLADHMTVNTSTAFIYHNNV